MTATESSLIMGGDTVRPVAKFPLVDELSIEEDPRAPLKHGKPSPDFLGSLERIKHLMRMIDVESHEAQATGLTIHRLGDSLILDRSVFGSAEDESSDDGTYYDHLNPLVLLPSSLLEEVSDAGGLKRSTALIDVKNTFVHIPSDDEEVDLPRYHSAPPGGYTNPPFLHVSPPRAIEDNVMKSLLRLPPSSPVCQRSAESLLPFLEKDHMSPMSRMNRAVEWNIAGFSVLLGCEIVLMDTPNKNMLSVDYSSVRELRDNEFWPNRPDAREAWLESNLLQVEKVAWINRERKSVEFMTTSSELCLEADVTGMLNSIKRVLTFLHSECKKQGATYCLVRGSDGCCHLYDVTDLPKDCNVLQVSQDLVVPIAKVCYSIVCADKKASVEDRRRLLQKGWKLLNNDSCQAEEELVALMAIELASLAQTSEERRDILMHALEVYNDRNTDTGQRLLVTAVTAITTEELPSIFLLRKARDLLEEISEERRAVECRGVEQKLNSLLGRALVTDDRLSENETKMQTLEHAIQLLRDAKDIEWEGTALNELGALLLFQDAHRAIDCLVTALERFSDAEIEEAKRNLLLGAVIMNLCKAFKKLALDGENKVTNSLTSITLALLAQKLSKSIVPESAVGIELYTLGSQLVSNNFEETSDMPPAFPRMKEILLSLSTVIGKAFAGIPRRKLGSTGLSVGDIAIVSDVNAVALARSCLELSLLYVNDRDRAWLRPQVDFQMARLITETNGDGKEALRHINKVFSSSDVRSEILEEAVCLKATIQFKLGEVKNAIHTLISVSPLSQATLDCLKTICMHDIKSPKPFPKSKPILEAIIRKQTSDFITAIARS